jgi:hypothetical protein
MTRRTYEEERKRVAINGRACSVGVGIAVSTFDEKF